MMKLSIFTPTHDPKYILDIYERLKNEQYNNWEWIIVPNGGAVIPPLIGDSDDSWDPRVIVVDNYRHLSDMGIGALKSLACENATGDVLIELDHDDIPVTGFMPKISDAFRDDKVDFAYSNFAEFHDKDNTPHKFNPEYGWRYRDFEFEGNAYSEAIAPPMEPPYILDITHTPNHFRCWRRSFYNAIGGYDTTLYVGDDYEILLRTYLNAKPDGIRHIDECLYLYRFTGNNSYTKRKKDLRDTVLDQYGKQLFPVLLKWASDNNTLALDLGSAHSPAQGFKGVDVVTGSDFQADLSKPWPFDDNSVGVIRAFDFAEHIEDKVHFMNEAWRVLSPNGALIIHVPSSEGWGADQDPTHRSRWNPNSFWYFTNDNYKKYCPNIFCSYMPYKMIHYFPSDFHKDNNIPYVQAHLFAIKTFGHKWGMPMPCMTAQEPPAASSGSIHCLYDDKEDDDKEDNANELLPFNKNLDFPVERYWSSDSSYKRFIAYDRFKDMTHVGLLNALESDDEVCGSKLVSMEILASGLLKGSIKAIYSVEHLDH